MDDTERRLAELTERVQALEEASRGRTAPTPDLAAGELDADLLRRLQQRTGPANRSGGAGGSVLYAGAATTVDGTYLWQMERPVPGLLELDEELLAATLGAISSPTRIRLLKALVEGAHETHELQAALGGVSAGQLYHHLKELTAAGIVAQRGRGRYAIAPHTVVPILAVFAAVLDVAIAPPSRAEKRSRE